MNRPQAQAQAQGQGQGHESGRKRSRLACQTCRDLKRKCNGEFPCSICVRFEYNCVYNESKTRKSHRGDHQPAVSTSLVQSINHPIQHEPIALPSASTATQSLEANSGSAFFRKLASRLDAKKIPNLNAFPWNVFQGSRYVDVSPAASPLTSLLAQVDMQKLAATFLDKVDPIYGFVNHLELAQRIESRWDSEEALPEVDATLLGIAALGCIFSEVKVAPLEVQLVESAKQLLDQTLAAPPSVTIITAWLLRVVYLRIAGTHYPTWLASCMVMHMIESCGLMVMNDSILPNRQAVDPETANRLVTVALHLNLWSSFDMGLSRVALPTIGMSMPSERPGDYTRELMELLPLSIELDPTRTPSAADLEKALDIVMSRVHTAPPSVLAQCNLALCLCRRMRSIEATLTDSILQRVLTLTNQGIRASQEALQNRAPWHHVIYVPMQIVCVLLAIDTVPSISQLGDAMQCLKDISLVYKTPATQDALKTARSLVMLHKAGKELFATALNDVLKVCEASVPGPSAAALLDHGMDWLENETVTFADLETFDLDQFLTPEFFWNAGSNGPC